MSQMGRQREFADASSGHTSADRPGAVPAEPLTVSSPPHTGRWPGHARARRRPERGQKSGVGGSNGEPLEDASSRTAMPAVPAGHSVRLDEGRGWIAADSYATADGDRAAPCGAGADWLHDHAAAYLTERAEDDLLTFTVVTSRPALEAIAASFIPVRKFLRDS